MPRMRSLMASGLGASVLSLGLVFVGSGAASAHVTVDPETTAADSYTVMTVSVPHGCEGKPTEKVRIGLPDELSGVTPSVNPNWKITAVHEDDDSDKDVKEIDYTAKTPLAADQRDSFELSFYLPPETEGTTLIFPTTQECTEGETKWDQVPKEGQSEDDLDLPAPSFTVTAPEADSSHGGESAASPASSEESAGSDDAASSESSSAPLTLGIIGVVLGALGLIAGGLALLATKRRV